jgi:hypothetical protein
MVVAIVILILTAVSIITLSGGTIGKFTDWVDGIIGGETQAEQIREKCRGIVQTIQTDYCELYTNGGTCSDVQRSRNDADGYSTTATEEDCNWQDNSGSFTPDGTLTDTPDGSRPVVEVEGEEFDCIREDYIVEDFVCPAETTSEIR